VTERVCEVRDTCFIVGHPSWCQMYQENDDALILDTSVYTMMTSMPITDDSRGLRPDDFLPNVDGRQDIPRRDCRPTRIVRQVAAVGTTAQIVSSPLLSCCSLRNLGGCHNCVNIILTPMQSRSWWPGRLIVPQRWIIGFSILI
jgi:hypothetical protein